jgi:hypothetical protein
MTLKLAKGAGASMFALALATLPRFSSIDTVHPVPGRYPRPNGLKLSPTRQPPLLRTAATVLLQRHSRVVASES